MHHDNSSILYPTDLAIVDLVLKRTAPRDCTDIERESLAAEIIDLFQGGLTDEEELVRRLGGDERREAN